MVVFIYILIYIYLIYYLLLFITTDQGGEWVDKLLLLNVCVRVGQKQVDREEFTLEHIRV